MQLNLRPMRCGGCGMAEFRLFTADKEAAIHVECHQCGSVSRIEPAPSKLQINWEERRDGEDSDGRLTVWPD